MIHAQGLIPPLDLEGAVGAAQPPHPEMAKRLALEVIDERKVDEYALPANSRSRLRSNLGGHRHAEALRNPRQQPWQQLLQGLVGHLGDGFGHR